jgi:uncharacterized protein YcfJ
MFKKILLAVALSASFAAGAQEASITTTHADGTIETRIPKIEQTCEQDATSKIINVGIGAAAGWLVGKAGSKAAHSQNENLWAGGSAVAGALVGNNIDKFRVCEKLVGHTVIRTKDGKTTQTFEPVAK